jgi:hypothetical protein
LETGKNRKSCLQNPDSTEIGSDASGETLTGKSCTLVFSESRPPRFAGLSFFTEATAQGR